MEGSRWSGRIAPARRLVVLGSVVVALLLPGAVDAAPSVSAGLDDSVGVQARGATATRRAPRSTAHRGVKVDRHTRELSPR